MKKGIPSFKYLSIAISVVLHLILVFIFINLHLREGGVKKVRMHAAIIHKEVGQDIISQQESSLKKLEEDFALAMAEPSLKLELGTSSPPVLTVNARPVEVPSIYHPKRRGPPIQGVSPFKRKPQRLVRSLYSSSNDGRNKVGFLGVLQGMGEVRKKNIVFVIDVSTSMMEVLPDAKKSLLNCLGYLTYIDRFNIIFFYQEYRCFREELIRATSRNIRAAHEFIESLKSGGGTFISQPIEKAFSFTPNIIFLLSDGVLELESPETIRRNVAEMNKECHPKVKIETFGFNTGDPKEKEGEIFLRRLAGENNGHFHRVEE